MSNDQQEHDLIILVVKFTAKFTINSKFRTMLLHIDILKKLKILKSKINYHNDYID